MMGETLSVTSQKTGLFSYCTCTQDRRRNGEMVLEKNKNILYHPHSLYMQCVYIYIYLSRKFVHGLCTSIRLECIMWIPHVIFAVWACCLRPCGFKLWHYGV